MLINLLLKAAVFLKYFNSKDASEFYPQYINKNILGTSRKKIFTEDLIFALVEIPKHNTNLKEKYAITTMCIIKILRNKVLHKRSNINNFKTLLAIRLLRYKDFIIFFSLNLSLINIMQEIQGNEEIQHFQFTLDNPKLSIESSEFSMKKTDS
ncbi:hypothetical protein Anas_11951 [Armadillidium nasatum]|uniref:Uncharacterized protein n=1 Tax=Armadillidium nasatum TaxID=96803 RepID=A0A5N5TBV0_9CRUS|nr:hypothetical protein Anas_11951 [Armadillidium nasatum]